MNRAERRRASRKIGTAMERAMDLPDTEWHAWFRQQQGVKGLARLKREEAAVMLAAAAEADDLVTALSENDVDEIQRLLPAAEATWEATAATRAAQRHIHVVDGPLRLPDVFSFDAPD